MVRLSKAAPTRVSLARSVSGWAFDSTARSCFLNSTRKASISKRNNLYSPTERLGGGGKHEQEQRTQDLWQARRSARVSARQGGHPQHRRRQRGPSGISAGLAMVERRQAAREDAQLRGAALPVSRVGSPRDQDGRRHGDRGGTWR